MTNHVEEIKAWLGKGFAMIQEKVRNAFSKHEIWWEIFLLKQDASQDLCSKDDSQSYSLTRIGKNKLVSSLSQNQIQKDRYYRGRQNVIKRVKLSGESQVNETSDEESTENSLLLTSYAYKEASTRSLVRVNPTSATPVCPSVLRGIPCTDEKCLKRHDVSRDAATPLCIFFQKNGMCHRQNCRFRHVKMSKKANLCPDFSSKGFCNRPNCRFRHLRINKTANLCLEVTQCQK